MEVERLKYLVETIRTELINLRRFTKKPITDDEINIAIGMLDDWRLRIKNQAVEIKKKDKRIVFDEIRPNQVIFSKHDFDSMYKLHYLVDGMTKYQSRISFLESKKLKQYIKEQNPKTEIKTVSL